MIKARGRRVVVRLPKTEERLDSGLWIPESVQEPPMEGTVLAAGECEDVSVGDRVVFEQWAGLEHVDEEWGDVVIVEARDLMMVVSAEVN